MRSIFMVETAYESCIESPGSVAAKLLCYVLVKAMRALLVLEGVSRVGGA